MGKISSIKHFDEYNRFLSPTTFDGATKKTEKGRETNWGKVAGNIVKQIDVKIKRIIHLLSNGEWINNKGAVKGLKVHVSHLQEMIKTERNETLVKSDLAKINKLMDKLVHSGVLNKHEKEYRELVGNFDVLAKDLDKLDLVRSKPTEFVVQYYAREIASEALKMQETDNEFLEEGIVKHTIPMLGSLSKKNLSKEDIYNKADFIIGTIKKGIEVHFGIKNLDEQSSIESLPKEIQGLWKKILEMRVHLEKLEEEVELD